MQIFLRWNRTLKICYCEIDAPEGAKEPLSLAMLDSFSLRLGHTAALGL